MPTEIERKFLVSDTGILQNSHCIHILQGYLFSDDHSVFRLRLSDNSATLTIKGKISDLERLEYEYLIPVEHAKELLSGFCHHGFVEKIRHHVEFDGNLWEIDEFMGDNSGLIVAEIELKTTAEKFSVPPWAGAEVSHDGRYTNSQLARHPFSQWGIRPENDHKK